MASPRPSPFIDQPFDVAVAGTESLVEDWLRARKVSEAAESAAVHPRRWYHGCIGGVPIPTLIQRLWTASGEGLRTNRYRLPRWVYLTVFSMMWAAAVGQVAVAIPEALEAAHDQWRNSQAKDYDGPTCGKLPVGRAYRIIARGAVSGLPMLVTLTIFLFPALYKA